MYRIFKFGCSSLSNVQAIPIYIPQGMRKCSLCNKTLSSKKFAELKIQESRYSTSIIPVFATEDRKKRKHRSRKKYIELLEVGENQMNERRAAIKKVSARNISLLSEPGNSINKGRKCGNSSIISNSEESKTSVRSEASLEDDPKEMLAELEEMQEEGMHGQEVLLDAIPADTLETENSILQEFDGEPVEISIAKPNKKQKLKLTKEKREKLAKVKYEELEKLGREKSLNNCLVSYLELCSNCSFLNRAWATLDYYLKIRKNPVVKNVEVFNTIIEAFVKHGKIDKVFEIRQIMQSLDIKPTIATYALQIECIARSSKVDKFELLNSTLRAMQEQKLELSDMFNKCHWRSNSREVVLGAIRAVHSQFIPVVSPPEIHYTCRLLNHLNALGNSNLNSPTEGLFNIEHFRSMSREQLKMERDFFISVKSVEKSDIKPNSESSKTIDHYRTKLEELKSTWEKNIIDALHRDLATMNALHKHLPKIYKQINLYPYLVVLEKNEYKNIIMHEIRKLAEGSETFSPSVNQLYKNIGSQVKLRYDMKVKCDYGLLKKIQKIYDEYCKWYLQPRSGHCNNSRQQWQDLVHKFQEGPSMDLELHPWPSSVLQGIGKFLYNIILRDIRIDVNIFRSGAKNPHLLPAFYSVYRNHGHITKEEVKPHPVLSRLYRAALLQHLTFNVSEVPMVSPPIPWTSLNNGGYMLAKTNIVRLPNYAVQQWERLTESPKTHLYPSFDSLNQLGSIPWKVNKNILDVAVEVFNSGGSSKLDIPEPPTICPMPDPITPNMAKMERFQAYKQRMVLRRRKAEMYSLWCDALYKLSLANHFRDRIFWLPHNMDFRGRVYPCPPHLNHLGADMARSLLVFAKGEPLGDKGFEWLKIHLVNLTGLKKRNSIQERLEFANEKMPEILDSANKPLTGEKWWMESEEPWQTLACCMEIRDALDSPYGPKNYVSYFPVHQDGSCNGLQHYAALGRDTAGAHSVNLAPSDIPQDVYSCVVAIVERERANDAKVGVEIAEVLEGFVSRKVIKQTVMTTVYGVTRFGARLQIAKQLKDIDNFPKEFVWPASSYLVAKTFASIREMFTSTREIQDWFTESARMISQVCGQNVEYVTPLGLPVVQPYMHASRDSKSANTSLSNYSTMDMFERPNVMKQKNAFPPNFIHSLDSCHMMLTSLHCEQAGITFVSVHDCYWTHARNVNKMNKICREQFVALHSEPILKDLSDFLVRRYSYSNEKLLGNSKVLINAIQQLNALLLRLPPRGDFELKNVIDSVYFFS